jgi:hypothetical protein
MADSITSALPGFINFIRLEGEVQPPAVEIAELEPQTGVNGRFFRALGIRSKEFVLRGVTDVSNAVAAGSLKSLAKSFQGTFCTIAIQGVTWSNYLCLDTQIVETMPVVTVDGGYSTGTAQKYLVTIDFVFVYGAIT